MASATANRRYRVKLCLVIHKKDYASLKSRMLIVGVYIITLIMVNKIMRTIHTYRFILTRSHKGSASRPAGSCQDSLSVLPHQGQA